MKLVPAMPLAPVTRAANGPRIVEVRDPHATSARAGDDSLGHKLMQDYQRDVAMLPGITLIKWSYENPDAVELFFEDPQLTALSQGVLRDTVNGAHWVFETEDGAPPLPSAPGGDRLPWYQRGQNMASAALALPGVDDLNFDRTTNEVIFYTRDAQTADHLRPLLNSHFGTTGVFLGVRDGASALRR